MIPKPDLNTIPAYYHYYTGLQKESDLIEAFKNNLAKGLEFLNSIPAAKESFRYAPEKWSVKEVLSHVIDTERILTYRALRFSRKDQTPLEGFEENDYAPNSNAENRSLSDMIEEYKNLRNSTLSFYKSLSTEMTEFRGLANKNEVSVKGIGWMIAGHETHHFEVIRSRYLNEKS